MSQFLEELMTEPIEFIIAMVILTTAVVIGLYGYWTYANHVTLENYLWPVAEVVPLRNGSYYLGIVNTGNEPIIVEDIYTNNSKVLSVDAKPLSHNQWLTETLNNLPVAVRVCSAIDPKVCTVVPVHGWGYARLFGGVWVNVTGQACNFEFWKILWYNGSGGLIWESQDLSWYIPTNQTVNFIAKVYGWTTCTSTLVSSQKIGNNTIENCYQETCNYPVMNGPSSAEPGENATFTLGCGTTTTYYCTVQTINNTGGNNNTGQPPSNGTSGPPGNSTNKPPSCSITLVPSYIEESKPGNYTVTVTAELGKGCPTGGTWTWGPYYNYYVVDYFVNGTPITGAWGSVYGENGVGCDVNGVNGNGPSATVVITCS